MQNTNGIIRSTGCCLLLLLAVGALWLTCDQQSPINPTQSMQGDRPILIGSASPPKIVSGGGAAGLSQIRVRLLDKDSNPIQNAIIIFTTTLGTLNAAQDSTDNNGWAEVWFQSGLEEGTATITARYGSAVSYSLSVEIMSQSDNPILLYATRNSLYANGLDTTRITIILSEDYLNETTEDIIVKLTADLGYFSSPSLTFDGNTARTTFISEPSVRDTVAEITATFKDFYSSAFVFHIGLQMEVYAYPKTIPPDGVSQSTITTIIKESTRKIAIQGATLIYGTDKGTIPNTAETNSQGVAQVNLTSAANDTGTAHVTVRYGGMDPITVNVNFSYEAPTTHYLARVSADPNIILANGSDYSEISAYVINTNNEPVSDVLVRFESDYGTISTAAFTNSNGLATASLFSNTSETDITANVKAILNQYTDSTNVTFEGVRFIASATPDSILANGFSTATISALVKKTRSNVVVPNQTVRFESSSGTLINGQATTNGEGIASVVLKSSTSPGIADVVAFYGHTITDTARVAFIESTPEYIKVTADPEVLLSDETSKSTIEARVTDSNQIPVPGTEVTFELVGKTGNNYWGTINPATVFTNDEGFAYSTLTSGDTPDTVMVRAFFGEKGTESYTSDSVYVEYIAGDVNKLRIKLEKYNTALSRYEETESIQADGLEKCRITVTVQDAYGHLLPWMPVSFNASIGNITPTAQTDINGEAVAYFSSDVTGATIITATVQKLSGGSVSISENLYLLPGPPNSIVLSFNPIEIGVKGTGQNQTSTISAEVRDSKNNIVRDSTLVVFKIVEGPNGGEALSTNEPIPTVGGISNVSISSGTISGNVRVQAKIVELVEGAIKVYTNEGGDIISESSMILIHAGPPYMEDRSRYYSTHLTIVAEQLNIWWGLGSTPITVSVFDKYHNPVQNSEVYLTASGGGITTHGTKTDANGIVNATLYGANPQPYIHKFYYGELMKDPNDATIVLPGPVYYPALDEYLLPNFDAYPGGVNSIGSMSPWSPVINTMEDSITICTRYNYGDPSVYSGLENDGIARIIAQVEGRDQNGDSLRVWDQIYVVYSGAVSYQDNSDSTFYHLPANPSIWDNTMYWGESRVLTFSLMDHNGNPIESDSRISAMIPQEVDAALSWDQINTGWGVGTSYYYITVSNTMSPEDDDPKPGTASIKIEWVGAHQFGSAITNTIFVADTSRPVIPGPPGL